ncbi:unnamed protein product [Miscanthus lutarioriparius]|uniref:Cytochrome P450 n=1 Tax=Miscanthus lutarioriparius TaxID=422564 RepID=A0A811NAM4_9POAL|nr:unnamed protein product [Miscanthus lutarioriparius]
METETSTTSPPLVLYTLLALVAAALLFLLRHARAGKNPAPESKGHQPQLPPGPPALVFLAKFLTLRRSIFDLGPLLRDLHARHGPVISVCIFRTLVFVADRRLAHRALVQGGATFADRPPLVDPGRLFTAGARDVSSSPTGPTGASSAATSPPRRCTRLASASSRQPGAGCATRLWTTSSSARAPAALRSR